MAFVSRIIVENFVKILNYTENNESRLRGLFARFLQRLKHFRRGYM